MEFTKPGGSRILSAEEDLGLAGGQLEHRLLLDQEGWGRQKLALLRLPGDQLPAVFAWPLLLHNDSDGVVQELVARFSELFQKQMRTVKTQALA